MRNSNPFIPNHVPIPELFINREIELKNALRFLCEEQSNLRISGLPGVGKTSFLHQLYYLINREFKEIFVVRLELFSAIENKTDLSSYFLSTIISQILVFLSKRNISSVLNELRFPDEPITKNSTESKLISLLKLVRSNSIKSNFNREASIGAKVLVEGKLSTRVDSELIFNGLFPNEFENILIELLEIIKKYKKDRIILLLDEANYLTAKNADSVIRKNFNILLNEHINYGFVTFSKPSTFSYESEKIFQREVYLNNFKNVDVLTDMIQTYAKHGNKVNKQKIDFSQETIDIIWKFSVGHPKITQNICYDIWEYC